MGPAVASSDIARALDPRWPYGEQRAASRVSSVIRFPIQRFVHTSTFLLPVATERYDERRLSGASFLLASVLWGKLRTRH